MRYAMIALGSIVALCVFGFVYERLPEKAHAWLACTTHALNDKDWCDSKLGR